MAHRRLFSALAWFALAAAGLVLLFPDLFPEVHMPAVLVRRSGNCWACC